MIRGKWKHKIMPVAVQINEVQQLRIGVSTNDGKDYLVIAPWVCYAKKVEEKPTWKPKVGEKGDGKTIVIPIENAGDIQRALMEVLKDYDGTLPSTDVLS